MNAAPVRLQLALVVLAMAMVFAAILLTASSGQADTPRAVVAPSKTVTGTTMTMSGDIWDNPKTQQSLWLGEPA